MIVPPFQFERAFFLTTPFTNPWNPLWAMLSVFLERCGTALAFPLAY